MPVVKVSRSKLVGAPPEKVYRVLVEPVHHKQILPEAFVRYEPESDSIVSYSVKTSGLQRDFRARIEEIEPNKLLRETDLATGICTEFSLEPHNEGTLATISTSYKTKPTPAGWLESVFAPAFLQQLYEEELTKLGRYVLIAKI